MREKKRERKESLQQSIRQMMGHTDLAEDVFIKAIEDSLRAVALKHYGSDAKVSIDIQLDREEIKCHVPKTVVDIMRDFSTEIPIEEARKLNPDAKLGDTLDVEINPEEFGRIQAQLGRQVLLNKLREAEREQIYNEFEGREGEVVVGHVQHYEKRDIIIDLERTDVLRTEALLPANQIPSAHHYKRGDALRCLILQVNSEAVGQQIIVSRIHPTLIARLFEQEVPEVYEGQVRVMAVARDTGHHAKVAVIANEENIDAVGTCVGVRGARVQAIVRELRNEKIDILEWDADDSVFIMNALKPAAVTRVELNEAEQSATVIVPDNQLSLAIGRRGQNARLAAQLTGWRIDVKSESEVPLSLDTLFKENVDEAETEEPAADAAELTEAVTTPETDDDTTEETDTAEEAEPVDSQEATAEPTMADAAELTEAVTTPETDDDTTEETATIAEEAEPVDSQEAPAEPAAEAGETETAEDAAEPEEAPVSEDEATLSP